MKKHPILFLLPVMMIVVSGCGQKTKIPESASNTGKTDAPAAVKLQPSVTIPNPQAMPSFTMDEVSSHASSTNCWMAIDNKVYDVTRYIPNHPGGEKIIEGCGKDATGLFNAIAKHDGRAKNMLPDFEIGGLAK